LPSKSCASLTEKKNPGGFFPTRNPPASEFQKQVESGNDNPKRSGVSAGRELKDGDVSIHKKKKKGEITKKPEEF